MVKTVISAEQYKDLREKERNDGTKSSPKALEERQHGAEDRPGLIVPSSGLNLAGIMRGAEILKQNGRTYGDTDIDPNKGDTRQRIDRAREVLPEPEEFYKDPKKALNEFARRIHKEDVVGDYFPAVLLLQQQQQDRLGLARNDILERSGAGNQIRELRASRRTQNSLDWNNREPDGSVSDEAVLRIEDRNEEIDRAILQLERDAAAEVLGDRAAEIEAEARGNLKVRQNAGDPGISELEMERRITDRMMSEAAEVRLETLEPELAREAEAKGEEFKTYDQLVAEEDAAWREKHETQSDFSDAMRDGNPDCSEYASLTAVSLAESGIPNVRVMGHTLSDDSYPMVGAHAYNIILDETGTNIIGVFEGTATTGAFKEVMNDVSLAEFEAGATLVTFEESAGWATYGTGSPANGKGLYQYDHQRGDLVTNIIQEADTELISQHKMEHLHSMTPEVMADQIIDMYEQYGDTIKIQGWIDMIRDDGNPAFAQAAQFLHDYEGEMPPPASLRNEIIDIVSEARTRGIANDNYDIAITEEDLYDLENAAAASMAGDMKIIFERLNDADPAYLETVQAQFPWLERAMDLMEGRPSYFEALTGNNRDDREAYYALRDIVRNYDISEEDFDELYKAASQVQSKDPGSDPSFNALQYY